MGYKLAGFDVVAANDIDSSMAALYRNNHNPKQFFECSVFELLDRNDLPEVDILDGSPPCSVFSVAGLREKAWGVKKKFREGQKEQILDSLFFDFEKLVRKMHPSVVVAENVKGMIQGKAKRYAKEYTRRMSNNGYVTQVFLINGTSLGLPQQRERVFFISNRFGKKVELDFNESPVPFSEISDNSDTENKLTPKYEKYWNDAKEGEPVGKFESRRKLSWDKPARTITASEGNFHPKYKRVISTKEEILASSFPQDYDFMDVSPTYVMGMSVPPLMMAKISNEIRKQILE